MPIYIDTETVHDYVLKSDRDLPESEQVRFKYHAPSLSAQTRFQKVMMEQALDGGEDAEGNAEDAVKLDLDLLMEVLKETLVGWSRWMAGSTEVTFRLGEDGRISDDSLAKIGMVNRIELAGIILSKTSMGEREKE